MKYVKLKKLKIGKKYIIAGLFNGNWLPFKAFIDEIPSQQYPIFGIGGYDYLTLSQVYHLWDNNEDSKGRTYEIAVFDTMEEAADFCRQENAVLHYYDDK